MKLPASLAPWARHLQIFPEEISLILGEYVRKISPFINPISAPDEESEGFPNGYDGVARRGIYERLLLSELALADDFAEEFIRRAAMGEHLFLHLAKIAPAAKRISVALFDSGALQLGTPRIAHIAALIALARRAEAARAAFLWGVLQDGGNLVISDDTEASVKILLESRTAPAVTAEDIAAWREKLSEADRLSDVWLVGGGDLARFAEAKNFSHLLVEESLELEKRELRLKIKSASGIERETVLPLPEANLCTRLLRNPFEAERKAPLSRAKIEGAVTNFFFDPTGTRLFAKLDSSSVLAFAVQNVRGSERIYPTTYRPLNLDAGKPVNYLAVGQLRKAVAVFSEVDYDTIRLEYRKKGFGLKRGLYRASFVFPSLPRSETGLLQIHDTRPYGGGYNEAVFVDADGNLFALNQISQDSKDGEAIVGTMMLWAKNVLAVAQIGYLFTYIGCEDENDYHTLVSISETVERRALTGKGLPRAVFGRGAVSKKVIGVEDEAGNWSIYDEEFKPRPMPSPKGDVVGVFHDERFAPGAGFFELMDDRRTLEFCWQFGRRKTVLTAAHEIVKIQFSPRAPLLAYQTAQGELVLYSLTLCTAIGRYSK